MAPQPVNSNAKALIMNQNIVEMSLTYGGLALGLALVAIMVWIESRPRKSLDPRLVPTTPLMFVGAFICLVAVVHIVNSLGIHTGR
ncbi:MAG TPA: hypothetical protein VJ019_07725 [Aestuariivirga sp.]|nr:hypothetical protein [Aestuariivirga sp.]